MDQRQDDLPDGDAGGARHDRRYILFAIGLAIVVLAFAAISITVVISMAP